MQRMYPTLSAAIWSGVGVDCTQRSNSGAPRTGPNPLLISRPDASPHGHPHCKPRRHHTAHEAHNGCSRLDRAASTTPAFVWPYHVPPAQTVRSINSIISCARRAPQPSPWRRDSSPPSSMISTMVWGAQGRAAPSRAPLPAGRVDGVVHPQTQMVHPPL